MIHNYLKIFFRLFRKQTAFTLINIVGLALGLACCLLIAMYVRHELSYDRFFANAPNLYRVGTLMTQADGAREQAMTYYPVAALLTDNIPSVTGAARMRAATSLLRKGEDIFYENEFKLADPEFFQVFDFTWLEGNPDTALSGATDVIVTRSFAQKYFGSVSALGQSVLMVDGPELRVTGVIEDLPLNTHLSGTVFASMALQPTLRPASGGDWGSTGAYTYVALRPDVELAQFRQQLEAFARATIPQTATTSITLTLNPVIGLHLNPVFGDWTAPGSKLNIAVFSAIGLGILLIACANFINLSTARSTQRFHEVGLRLTLGARRSQLLLQFLGESVLFVLLASVLALAFVEVSLPAVQGLLGLTLAYNNLTDALPLPLLLGVGMLLGLCAGWYPAVVMSGYKPAVALRDPSRSEIRGLALKNVLVVLQFAIAITMLIASTVLYLQLRFAGALDLGYDSEQVMVIQADDSGRLFKERVLQSAIVRGASMTESTPDQPRRRPLVNAEGSDAQHRLPWFVVDFDYFTVYDIALLQGRLPREALVTDRVRAEPQEGERVSGSVVLNTSGAQIFGWSAEEAIGKLLFVEGAWLQVIGIVKDTLISAYVPAQPAIYSVPEDRELGVVAVKFAGTAADEVVALVERTWKEVNSAAPLTSIFQSELVATRYEDDNKRQNLAFLFAGMAVVLSCMGLFGLANFSTQYRTKEIGVRKVMGGSVWSIVWLLTNDFSKLVLISNVIAWPLAYVAMERWLENFAYRIDLTPLVFIGSGLIALCVAWVTVGGTAAKAASQKPVLALRYE